MSESAAEELPSWLGGGDRLEDRLRAVERRLIAQTEAASSPFGPVAAMRAVCERAGITFANPTSREGGAKWQVAE